MKTRIVSLFTGALLGIAIAACSTTDEAAGTQESEWVIKPNGTNDRATITVKGPDKYDPGSSWVFVFGDKRLEAGAAVVVPLQIHDVLEANDGTAPTPSSSQLIPLCDGSRAPARRT